ncbi:hypothetical protein RHSIM_RhsimUnG0176300 [Rhododendron simsii]|uniref:Legume lectin domain-containing protein n=1 Tax=Rhododendron simsii TaxID=118357 RepID=A0A834FUE0_RHOSS|nr:hypothetical protein RHSIM_RhsimUnG0176300 [Rhododendron simsii]
MAIFNFQILLYSSLSISFCILFPQTTSLTFNLTNLALEDQNANITTFGNATFSTLGLQLTSLENQVGKATYIDCLHLWDNSTSTRNLTDFSSHFVFVIDSEARHTIADGFAFFLAPNGSHSEGRSGMGLPVKTGTDLREPSGTFVAVEFDTFWNQDTDPDTMGQDPHVGIDVNSVVSKVTAVWYPNIPAGIQNEAWIRYDSNSFNLSVVFTSSTNTTRVQDTINLIIDLSDYLPEWVTFGFSASTGSPRYAKTIVKSWEFSTSLEMNRNVTDPVKPGSKKISIGAVVGLVVGTVVLVGGFVLVGFRFWRRSPRAKEEDEFEVEMSMESEFEVSNETSGMGLGPLWSGKKSKEDVEASKAKNSEESSVHGEGIKRVEDDQFSQIPTEGHVSKVESDEEYCNEESSVHGLNSWVEDSAVPFFATNKDQSKEIKDKCDNDQRLEIPVPNEQVQNGDRSITLLNEPLVIDSRNNLGAFQMEGINLVVDLKLADLRWIRSQSFEDCVSSGDSEFVQNSYSSRGTREDQEEIDAELQLTTNFGKRLGVKITERYVQRMRKMIEIEVKEHVIIVTHQREEGEGPKKEDLEKRCTSLLLNTLEFDTVKDVLPEGMVRVAKRRGDLMARCSFAQIVWAMSIEGGQKEVWGVGPHVGQGHGGDGCGNRLKYKRAMAIFNFLLCSLSMFFLCILFPQTTSLNFNLTDLSLEDQNVNITTSPRAYRSTRGLEVTPNALDTNLQQEAGKVTYKESLHLGDNSTGNLTDFSTHFVFVIDSQESPNFADGLAFFLAPIGSNSTAGGAMGLPLDPETIVYTSPFVAVEFDTFANVWDPVNVGTARHVGIDVNSLKSNVTAVWYCNITHGIENEAWIRYDSSSHNLSVAFTGSTNTTRVNDTIHFIIDLREYLPERVTFGFSASTGGSFETHTIKSWDFSSSLEINENNNSTVPVTTENKNVTNQVKPGSNKISPGAVVGSVVGSGVFVGGFVLVGFGWWRRSKAKEEDEFDIEMSLENEFEADIPVASWQRTWIPIPWLNFFEASNGEAAASQSSLMQSLSLFLQIKTGTGYSKLTATSLSRSYNTGSVVVVT